MTTAPSARRPCAGAVPGRWGACLAVRTPPAALVLLPIPFGPTPVRHTAHGSETTSPRARVLNAWRVDTDVLSLRKRTEPSAKAKLAPPGWPLPKAQPRLLCAPVGLRNSSRETPVGTR